MPCFLKSSITDNAAPNAPNTSRCLGTNHLAFEDLLERCNDSLVQRRAPQEHDPLSNVALFHDSIQVIVDDCVAKTRYEILTLAHLFVDSFPGRIP